MEKQLSKQGQTGEQSQFLKGVRVVDFTRYLPGPFATLRLADMGAEVIKVEPPKTGDPSRFMSEQMGGTGLLFQANNRNKKSVTLDLKREAGRKLAFDLAAKADVVIEGFRPGVADALGIGYEALKQVRPDLIYCSLSGFGQTGPLRELGGHDLNYLALSGVLAQLKDLEGRPVQPSFQFADLIGGFAASEAILAALVKKSLTGEGSYLDIAMTDTLIGMMHTHVAYQLAMGYGHGVPILGGSLVCYRIYQTSDNRFVTLGALEKKFWENFCRAVGREEWIPAHFSRAADDNPVFAELRALFASRTLSAWSRFAIEVDCCMAPVLETAEMMDHPHVREKRLIPDQNTATALAPSLGQHTREVLENWLDASSEQIDRWEQEGIV
ncbi:CaiB/BaiF CoA transferase family protein [Effusibacillus lacus]|uniref:CoA transferase n=1 Tax=Effusibacillus lacus TaxID=1348429 RepID=A0A292YHZ1_9BACL|nr:CaiB/BaiF CoA-transferase family protein [Effusibacillus lacus]TCS74567.1 crotonobetainyl-CoA:carnitine CoA-transferase CaiB-like acyl-CoA transferase [Effusibacillus lacus]GAX88441.1 CoA transferase [Effusibacillus lacus]